MNFEKFYKSLDTMEKFYFYKTYSILVELNDITEIVLLDIYDYGIEKFLFVENKKTGNFYTIVNLHFNNTIPKMINYESNEIREIHRFDIDVVINFFKDINPSLILISTLMDRSIKINNEDITLGGSNLCIRFCDSKSTYIIQTKSMKYYNIDYHVTKDVFTFSELKNNNMCIVKKDEITHLWINMEYIDEL